MHRLALAVQGRTPTPTPRDPTGATARRGYLFDDLFVKRYDETVLDGAFENLVQRRMPSWARMAAEINLRRDEYDAIVTWSERVTLALMTVQSLSRRGKPHVPMMYWFSRPSVQAFMRAFATSLHGIVTWSSVQRAYAIEQLGVPSEKIFLVKHFVDQLFWSPREREVDTISSAGAEMRDYPTLLEALRGTNLPCHIATDHVRVDRFGFGRRVSASEYAARADKNVTVGRKSPPELRELYARSRFVVVPVRPSDTDNGVTVILEAMAMGKPVICSKTKGQVDVIQDGVTGIYVPVGDPVALRKAIVSLWNEPERAAEMGRAGRAYIEKYHALEKFCHDVKRAVDASLEGRPAAPDGSLADA
jgi:glycosyltransferase involved in cell wall biosynthesis